MAKKAKKKVVRREWTKNDVRELKSLAKQKIGVKKIADAKSKPGREQSGGQQRDPQRQWKRTAHFDEQFCLAEFFRLPIRLLDCTYFDSSWTLVFSPIYVQPRLPPAG